MNRRFRQLLTALLVIVLMILFVAACKARDSHQTYSHQTNRLQKEETKATSSALTPGLTDIPRTTADESNTKPTNEPVKEAEPDNSDTTVTEGDLLEVIGEDISKEFYYEELPEDVIERIQGKSYKDNCEVPYEELRYVRVLYQGFDEEVHRGELIVNKEIAEDIVDIFRELYDEKYPIERMVLVDEYDADDNTSMAADNTSAFNYRLVDRADHLSLHSYGLAIDINPLYNPYVRTIDGEQVVLPENGTEYADRSMDCKYYIDTEDACYKAFTEHGFTWGGAWKNSKDYQHFQKKLE